MSNKCKKYFVCANTCKGFVNYFPSNMRDKDRVYILKGGPGTGKSTLMKKIGEYFAEKDEEIEYIYCSSDTSSLDGIILKKRNFAVVDGTAPHVCEPTAPGAKEEYVNLGSAWSREMLVPYREDILKLNLDIKEKYARIYCSLAEAKEAYAHAEDIYAKNMDFDKLAEVSEDLVNTIMGDIADYCDGGTSVHRFSSALSADGWVDYTEELTDAAETRFFVKSRPGMNINILFEKIAEAAENRGIRAEIYHSPFDADLSEMIVLPSLKTAVFDCGLREGCFPSREGDVILDLYKAAVNPDINERYKTELLKSKDVYESIIDDVKSTFGEIRYMHDELEKYYINAVNFEIINDLTNQIMDDMKTAR